MCLILKPIKTKKGALGCFIIIINKTSISISAHNLRSNEDELIKKTLQQTNGNISKAAKILDINRATIYRRRKNWLQ
jgi:transcriptional regulator of acetoin/glycerol metabolism